MSPSTPAPAAPGATPAPASPAEAPAAAGVRTGRRFPVGEVVVAAGAVALGVFVFVEASGIVVPSSASIMGPRAFPYLVGLFLVGSGLAVLVGLALGRRGELEGGEDVDPDARTDWVTFAKLGGFLVAHVLLIGVIGWPLAAAVLFAGAAWSMGSPSWVRSCVVGLVLGITVQLVFGRLLGLSLPAGPLLERLAVFSG